MELELVSRMAVEEEGSAHRGAATSCAIVDCVIRVMKAQVVEPHSRALEPAWPCRHSVLQRALHCYLKVQGGDRTVGGYTQTCACDLG